MKKHFFVSLTRSAHTGQIARQTGQEFPELVVQVANCQVEMASDCRVEIDLRGF
jgi:hypothetical protein